MSYKEFLVIGKFNADFLKKTGGFSLVEMMIGVAVVAVAGAAMMNLMAALNQQQLTNQLKYIRMSSTLLVQQDLADETACTQSLKTLDPNTKGSVLKLKTGSGATLLDLTNQSTKKGDLTTLTLIPYSADPTNFAILNLGFSTAKGVMALQPASVRIAIEKASNGTILRCSTFGLVSTKSSLANTGCSSGKFVQGFDASGTPVCVSPPVQVAAAPAPAPAPQPSGTPVSSCGGTQSNGAAVDSISDPDGKGSYMGLACGMASGKAKLCYSCSAQWYYPSGVGTGNPIQCRCH